MERLVHVGCTLFIVAFWFALVALLSGCAAIVGIKEYRGSDGSVMKFVTGYDVGATANGVDTVENTRGIRPTEK